MKDIINFLSILTLVLLISYSTKPENYRVNIKKNFIDKLTHQVSLRIYSHGKSSLSLSNWNSPKVIINLKNYTKDTINVVLPGVGSSYRKKRSPSVRWSIIDKDENEVHPDTLPELNSLISYCGLRDGASNRDLISLAPKSFILLKDGINNPPIPRKIGTYGIKFYYQLSPKTYYSGRMIGATGDGKYSTTEWKTKDMLFISNELIFEVVE